MERKKHQPCPHRASRLRDPVTGALEKCVPCHAVANRRYEVHAKIMRRAATAVRRTTRGAQKMAWCYTQGYSTLHDDRGCMACLAKAWEEETQ